MSYPRLAIAGRLFGTLFVVPAIPIGLWWRSALDDRERRRNEVETKVRIPGIQTVDDLLIEKCMPGDVILFDRRCDRCAAGPLAAASCVLGRSVLCGGSGSDRTSTPNEAQYDHVGIVVPGDPKVVGDLRLLEATAGEGIVSRPLLQRLEMSQSRNMTLLPLSSAGERRNDPNYDPPEKTVRLREAIDRALEEFHRSSVRDSLQQGYANTHSLLCLTGAISYALGLHELMPAPVSPSAWLVVTALQVAGAGEHVDRRAALDARVEDFLGDHRFQESDAIRLRPGWKFLPPVTMRETSRY